MLDSGAPIGGTWKPVRLGVESIHLSGMVSELFLAGPDRIGREDRSPLMAESASSPTLA